MAIYKGQWEDNKTGNVLYPHTSTDVVFNSAGKNVDALLNEKSNSNHTHDDRYYTETEMNTKLNVKLNTTGNASNVTNTFTQATTLANLTTGEKLSISLGKIMKAIADLISHIGNKSNPHAVTKAQVGLGNVTNDAQVKRSEMGVANGVATLDTTGKVPSSQLPSYVDDVLEYTNKASFPATGEAGKIYVDKTTNKTYRWSGTAYVEISSSLVLGETSSTAYAGDKGKATTDNVNAILAGTKVVPKATDANTLDGKDSTAFANATHTHTKSQIKDFPTSMKNPTSMKLQLNGGTTEGTNQFTYDGSVAKTVNITPAGIGASHSSHTHTGSQVTQDATHRFATDTEKNNWNAKLDDNDMNPDYFEKKSNGKWGLKNIQSSWFAEDNSIRRGALCSDCIYQPAGYNALRVYMDMHAGGDKGILVVGCEFNQGGNGYTVFHWVKAGQGINVISSKHLGDNPIVARYASIEDNGIPFIDLQDIAPYSFVGIWCPSGINNVVPISV